MTFDLSELMSRTGTALCVPVRRAAMSRSFAAAAAGLGRSNAAKTGAS